MNTDASLQNDRAAEQREQLHALHALSLELSALRDLQSVMDTALRHCLSLTDSQFGFIGLNTADQGAMDVVAIQGFHPSSDFYHRYHVIPLRPNVFARAVLENRPVVSNQVMNDLHRVGQPHGHPPTHSFLGVPLQIGGQPIGMIGVANRATPYEVEHETLLVTYAAQVAIAISNARLNEALASANAQLEQKVSQRTQELLEAKEALAHKAGELHRLLAETVSAQERERQRISHDLHDGLNQLLIGAMLELQSGRERLSRGESASTELALRQVANILHRMDCEVRQSIADLRPPILDELGLVPSLRKSIEQFESRSGVKCRFNIVGNRFRVVADVEICIYRILQEALNNVAEHAHARQVNVTLAFSPDQLCLDVLDNASDELLVGAVRAVHRGERVLSPQVVDQVVQRFADYSREHACHQFGLSDADVRILRRIVEGRTNGELAAEMYLSEATVKRKLQDIFRKLNVSTRAQAAAEATRHNLV